MMFRHAFFALLAIIISVPVTSVSAAAGRELPPEAFALMPRTQPIPGITFSEYPVPAKPQPIPELFARGRNVYENYCTYCHGPDGTAQVEAARAVSPRPRNLAEAKYRLRSTPTGHLPTDEDLFRVISVGMPGTLMLPWRNMLSDDDRWAVVEYIKQFSVRFQDTNEPRTPLKIGSPPARSIEAIGRGKQLFAELNCAACHGETGRGNGQAAATLTDDAGDPVRPRDFTQSDLFKAGHSAREIARTVLTGMDGTPMAGFHPAVTPDKAWPLAYYVESLAQPAQFARPEPVRLPRHRVRDESRSRTTLVRPRCAS